MYIYIYICSHIHIYMYIYIYTYTQKSADSYNPNAEFVPFRFVLVVATYGLEAPEPTVVGIDCLF